MAIILEDRAMFGPSDRPRSGPTPKVLIAQRPPSTVYPGYWEFPGGKIEPGESPETAAVREVAEELGIGVVPATVLPQIIHTYDHATVELHPVIVWPEAGSPAPRNLGVAAHRWVTLADLPWAEFLPANFRIVTAILRALPR